MTIPGDEGHGADSLPSGEGGAASPLPHEGPLSGDGVLVGESGSMTSGPGVRFAFRLDAEMCLDEVAFETCGFDDARPVASALCRALLGANVDQASAASIADVARMAGVPEKSAAARTVHFAKSAALLPVLGRRARAGAHITCSCRYVATETIRTAIRDLRLRTVEEVRDATRAGTGCGTCRPELQRLLDENGR